jgi:Ca-activated chloride channel family protein
MPSPTFFSRVLGLTDLRVNAVAVATRFDPNVAIIIDRSGSMCEDSHPTAGANCPAVGPWQPFTTVQQIAKEFVDEFSGEPVMSLISFSTTARLDVPLTSNRAAIKTAIDELRPGGYTDIAASVNQSIDELLRSTNQRPNLIVLMTDGKPNTVDGRFVGNNDPRAREALIDSAKAAAEKGMTAYVINYGIQADNDLMREVAEETEGKFYYAPTNASLRVVYGEIATRSYIRLTAVN